MIAHESGLAHQPPQRSFLSPAHEWLQSRLGPYRMAALMLRLPQHLQAGCSGFMD